MIDVVRRLTDDRRANCIISVAPSGHLGEGTTRTATNAAKSDGAIAVIVEPSAGAAPT